jgi:hypothetical protein
MPVRNPKKVTKPKAKRSRTTAADRKAVENELLRVLERLDNSYRGLSPVTSGMTHTTLTFDAPTYFTNTASTSTYTSMGAIQGWVFRARQLALSLYRNDPDELHVMTDMIVAEAHGEAQHILQVAEEQAKRSSERIKHDRIVFEEYVNAEMRNWEEGFEDRVERTVRERIDKMFGRAGTLHRKRLLRIAPGCTAETL